MCLQEVQLQGKHWRGVRSQKKQASEDEIWWLSDFYKYLQCISAGQSIQQEFSQTASSETWENLKSH